MGVSLEQARRDRPAPEIAPVPKAGTGLKFEIRPTANPTPEKERAARLVEADIVRDEGGAARLLHDRVAAAVDMDERALGEFGLHTIEGHRALGEAAEHVELGDRRGTTLQRR